MNVNDMEFDSDTSSILEFVARFGEFANAVGCLVVGHRKLLVDGGFDINLADVMAAEIHASLLGLTPQWHTEEEHSFMEEGDEDDE